MSALTGKTPAQTYKDLLQVSNGNKGVDDTLRNVSDGEGTASALNISSNRVQVKPSVDGKTFEVVDVNGNSILKVDTATKQVSVATLNGYIPSGTINAKGDIIVGNATAQPERLPVGYPGFFIVADPTSESGLNFSKTIDGGTF